MVCFIHTFSFADANPDVHNALQLIHDIFIKVVSVSYPVDPHAHCQIHSMMECYNVTRGLEDDYDLWNINILEIEGSRDVRTLDISTNPMNQLLKIRKANIGMEENPKFSSVGDY